MPTPKAYLFIPSRKQLIQRLLGPVFKGGNSLRKAALQDLQQRTSQDQEQLAELGWVGGLKKWLKQN